MPIPPRSGDRQFHRSVGHGVHEEPSAIGELDAYLTGSVPPNMQDRLSCEEVCRSSSFVVQVVGHDTTLCAGPA